MHSSGSMRRRSGGIHLHYIRAPEASRRRDVPNHFRSARVAQRTRTTKGRIMTRTLLAAAAAAALLVPAAAGAASVYKHKRHMTQHRLMRDAPVGMYGGYGYGRGYGYDGYGYGGYGYGGAP